jgi:hypothetical protein
MKEADKDTVRVAKENCRFAANLTGAVAYFPGGLESIRAALKWGRESSGSELPGKNGIAQL